jgi:hypothetical protein
MFISHKKNVIQSIEEAEWSCRMMAKSFDDTSDYWAWVDSITTQDDDGFDVITYPPEDFTIVECTDEDVWARLNELGSYVKDTPFTGTVYNIYWSDDKENAEEILDDGKSQSPKVYVQSHFRGYDSARDERILAEEWTRIRRERNRLLAETDWMSNSDSPAMSTANKTYRQKLRDLPSDQKDETAYADITWPTKP